MDRHHITDAVSEEWIFTTLHEASAAVRSGRNDRADSNASLGA